jgi:hypothetical protein
MNTCSNGVSNSCSNASHNGINHNGKAAVANPAATIKAALEAAIAKARAISGLKP